MSGLTLTAIIPIQNGRVMLTKLILVTQAKKIFKKTMWQASHIAGFDKGNNSIFIYLKLQVGN